MDLPIVLLVGQKGAGKTTVGNLLREQHGFVICHLGEHVRSSLRKAGLELTAANERRRMQELKNNAEGTLLVSFEQAIHRWLNDSGRLCVDSLFDLNDLNFFRRRGLRWRLVRTTSNDEDCLRRIKNRQRQGDADMRTWARDERRRDDFNGLADYEIHNDAGLDELRQAVARLVAELA